MVRIVLDNAVSTILGSFHTDYEVSNEIKEELRNALSYQVSGAEWSEKYKEGTWDGKISLYNKREKSFPTGLLFRVKQVLQDRNVEFVIENKRVKPQTDKLVTTAFEEHKRTLRPYQELVIEAAKARGRGVLSVATGGGKTMISAELIAQLKALPVVFIVPSKTLMHQTRKEFHKYLRVDGEKTKIGIAGDSICDLNPDGINILTWQTALQAFDEKYTAKGDKVVYDEFTGLQVRKTKAQLIDDVNDATRKLKQTEEGKGDVKAAKAALKKAQTRLKNREQQLANKSQIKQLIRNTPVFIVDEAHTAAIVIQRLGEHATKSYYRFGVTATAWREDNQEIRIEGTFGRILINIRPSDLIRDGWLVKPYIFMVKIKHIETHSDYNDAYLKHVVNCWERNYRIKQFAEGLFAAGRKVLILVERLEHGEILEQMIYDSVFVPGKDDGSGNETITEEVENYRLEMLARCGRGENILIATQWANVGVDEPAIDSLILAGSNRSSVTTFQQVGRILRPADGKENAIVIDFSDEQDDLHDHSLKRKRAYALEPEFKVYRVQ